MTVYFKRNIDENGNPDIKDVYHTNVGRALYGANNTWNKPDVEYWLQPVEMPDGEVTVSDDYIWKNCLRAYRDGWEISFESAKWMRDKLTTLHLADKARAVDKNNKDKIRQQILIGKLTEIVGVDKALEIATEVSKIKL